MSEKRYAIVRVQKKCPYYEVISKKCLLDFEDCRKECINIKGKFQYGDTKEQLIAKVEQIIRTPIQKGDLELKSKGFKYGVRRIAKEIVEFLGVEDERDKV